MPLQNFKKYIIAGFLAIFPLWITYFVISIIVNFFIGVTHPFMQSLAALAQDYSPFWAGVLGLPWLQPLLSLILVILSLYSLGWLTSKWLGKKIMSTFDYILDRIPVAKSVYNSVRRLTETLQKEPGNFQQVVLIDFPSPEMKTVGLVTRNFNDAKTGEPLVAVYVPTTPNPTSGYLEILPKSKVTPISWTHEEAMTFVISGGSSMPSSALSLEKD